MLRRLLLFFLLYFSISCNIFAQKEDEKQEILASERDFLEGMKYYVLDNYGSAMDNFQKALKKNPKSSGIHYQIAQTLFKTKKITEAIEYTQKAINLEKNNKYYYLLLIKLYSLQGNNEKVAQTYKELLAQKIPNTENYLYRLAQIYHFKTKNYAQALATYEEMEKRAGVQEPSSKAKQLIYSEQKNYPKATEEAKKLADAFPENMSFQVNYAETLLQAQQTAQAQNLLEKLLAKDESYESHWLLYRVYKKEKNTQKAEELSENVLTKGDVPDLIKNRFLKENPKNSGILENSLEENPQNLQAWLIYAEQAEKNKQAEKAQKAYTKITEIEPNSFEAWQKLLYWDSELKQAETLQKHSEQAIELYPTQAIFWLYNGIAYYEQKKYNEALKSYEEAMGLSRKNIILGQQIRLRMADAYNATQAYDKSDKILEEILAQEPENLLALNNYSYYLAKRKQKLKIALQNAEKLIRLSPNTPDFQITYAWVLYQNNQLQKAENVLSKLVNNYPNAIAYEHYGDILFKLNQKAEALRFWKKSQEAGNNSPLLLKKIKEQKLYE